MKIDIYSDMVCPWCRIGKQNLNKALELWASEGGEPAEITFRAFQLDPDLPPEGLPFKQAMTQKMGDSSRVQQATEQVTSAGAAVGLTYRFDRVQRMPNTKLAHRFVALLKPDLQERAVNAIFRAYFEEGRDIALFGEIEAIATELGEEATAVLEQLRQGAGEDAVNADLESASRIGVTGVPFFIFDNKYALSGAYPPDKLVELMHRVKNSE
ncbi:DsbA family oxidoreductase [Paenibacillus spongiae]|uniref:DsbA family oxidoreductase n=1 Tax=Paenibacillus spongiae TaxID=2909671 RepID=A0ABY5SB37_9BACL|nr:DsbA family oxidoreductase [Paenibacillus spongiae]UVI29980.1 DsbA family oxidoreductase [Paenibacillus spongiae]